MDRLSALSAAFLSAEDVDPDSSMVIGSVGILRGPAPTLDDVRELVEDRLPPRYRQRVRRSLLGLRAPGWQDDEDFDVRRHVRRVAVPAPGGREELAELLGRTMSERMDRDHPLWDIILCEGLEGGQWALICRIHHALADGVSGTGAPAGGLRHPAERPPPPRAVGRRTAVLARRLGDGALRAGRGGWPSGQRWCRCTGLPSPDAIRWGRRYVWRRVSVESVRRTAARRSA